MYLNIIKAIYNKLMASIILKGELTESISSNIRNETRVSTLATLIQHSFGIPIQRNNTGRKHKRNLNREVRSQFIPICRQYDLIPKQPLKTPPKIKICRLCEFRYQEES
jgi:hypothetical protein